MGDVNAKITRFDHAAKLERLQSPEMVQKTKAARYGVGKIFVVQSKATGDGVYNCYEQTLVAAEWDDTAGDDKFDDKNSNSVEVFNLLENDPVASYSPALAVGDAIKAWQWIDDEGNKRWAGIPLVANPVRRAITTQAAPSQAYITANLYDHAGDEITTGLGSGINVYCNTGGGGNLDVSVPLLKDNQDITVQNIQGEWWCVDISFNTGQAALAHVKTTPGAVIVVSCWFSESDGAGQTISVPCAISGGGNLNAAVPRLSDGNLIRVTKNGAIWGCTTGFQAAINCVCTSP